jgi:hypothetical protein
VQRGGAVGDGERVLDTAKRGELAFELRNTRAHAPPAGAHGLEHGSLDFFVDADVRERNEPALLGWTDTVRAVPCRSAAGGRGHCHRG